MRCAILLLIAAASSFSLQAPYLISVTALSSTSVRLQWRNNSTESKGFYIVRRDTSTLNFALVSTVANPTEATFTDSLSPSSKYYYGVIAYSDTAVSDTSNIDSVTTPVQPAPPIIIENPRISDIWDTLSKTISIHLIDLSRCEAGFRLYRSVNFGPSSILHTVISAQPETYFDTTFIDNDIDYGSWYSYYVEEYKDTVTAKSGNCIVYAYQPPRRGRALVLGDKLSEFPINWGAWAVKNGDTILIRESQAPLNSITVINVTDKRNPVFEGYMQSNDGALFESFRYYGIDNALVGCDNTLRYWVFKDGALKYTGADPMSSLDYHPLIASLVNSTTLLIRLGDQCGYPYSLYFLGNQDQLRPISFIATVDGCNKDPLYSFCSDLLTFEGLRNNIEYTRYVFRHWDPMPGGGCATVSIKSVTYNFNYNPMAPIITENPTSIPTNYASPNNLVLPNMPSTNCTFIDTLDSIIYILSSNLLTINKFTTDTLDIQNENISSFQTQDNSVVYPNPFNPQTNIYFPNPNRNATVQIIGLNGRVLETYQRINDEKFVWNGSNKPAGVYTARIIAGSRVLYKKIVLIK